MMLAKTKTKFLACCSKTKTKTKKKTKTKILACCSMLEMLDKATAALLLLNSLNADC